MQDITKCEFCGAVIAQIKGPKGKLVPVNRNIITIKAPNFGQKPDAAIVNLTGRVVWGIKLPEGQAGMIGYESHYATCPYAVTVRKLAGME
jgi:hypothetical protein